MVNRSKAKGTSAETAVVDYLRRRGFTFAERRTLNGARDRGDITGITDTVIEVKNCKQMQLAAWVDEAEVERYNDDARVAVVWHKRRGRVMPGEWFVTMTGAHFVDLLSRAAA